MDPYVEITHRVAPGAALVRRWPLRGGVSAHVEALELALPDGSERRVVVRRHGAAHWKALTRDVTVVEYQLLSALSAAGLAVPLPLWVETGSELLGSPFFVMAYVDGAPELDPSELPSALAQMAEYLHRVHTLSVDVALPPREDPVAGALSFVAETDPVYEVLRSLSTQAPTSALVHGDYWPGNVLWKAGKLVAVLDWEDAAYGDPVSDLAGCRLELLWKYGASAAEAFSEHYLSLAQLDTTRLPVWELYAASAAAASMSDWGLPPDREADMRNKAQNVIAAARATLLRAAATQR
jgi:aminoglycoside phosphotransferase (APT) family kinase protein